MRRICQHCGAKRNIDQLEPVIEVTGRYFQKGKEVTLYVCKAARRKSTGYLLRFCNGETLMPELSPWRRSWRT